MAAFFPEAEPVAERLFSDAVRALKGGEVEVAMLPVENTLGGIVQEVNELLWDEEGIRIQQEFVLPVRHCLLGRRGQTVERALSHPQALAQTRRWLEARGIEPSPFYDTAGAAKEVARNPLPGVAAIASRRAAAIYGVDVLADDIQDDDSNRTRFLVLGNGPAARPADARSGDKVSLAFVVRHVPGGLVDALRALADRHLNLARLESRPIVGRPFEYKFFLDLQVDDPAVAEEGLRDLEGRALEVRLFGTYPAFGRGEAS